MKRNMKKRRFSFRVFVLLIVIYSCYCFSHATAIDTIRFGESISISETIVSSGGNFELGFFTPGNSGNYYVGIWYAKVSKQTFIWVANRDNPFANSSSSVLTVNKDGNLAIVNGKMSYAVTDISPTSNTSATLYDSGNLVLRSNINNTVLWQSFDYPTDTFLPGMKVGLNVKTGQTWSLTSWKSSEDPSPGDFTLRLDDESLNQFFIMQGSTNYWNSGIWDERSRLFTGVPEMALNYIYNYSYVSNENESYFTYSIYNDSIISRLVMDLSGQIIQFTWLETFQGWNLFWSQPRQNCEVHAVCGAFGRCSEGSSTLCECLQGFEPRFLKEWYNLSDTSGGCVRRTPLQQCGNNYTVNRVKDWFLSMSNVKLPDNPLTSTNGSGSAQDCEIACLNNCSCTAYAYGSDGCSIWLGDLLNLIQLSNGDSSGRNFNLRLDASEIPNTGGNKRWIWVTVPVVLTMLILISLMLCLWRRRLTQKGEKERGLNLLLFDFGINSISTGKESSSVTMLEKGRENNSELPLFSFASISTATDDFSAANKLGEGGFGPVYKGEILMGQKVAVKRLSKRSGQGLEELKNETILIARLQHRNLVRLLGCCTEQDEKILIYEYMPNKSLDSFLFDATRRLLLDWKTRVRIIEGIAQGLLYLHQYSRIKIIHRDLKASNILLDSDMNPKISDFGMARIFGGNDSQAKNTNRIVGTYGYMSPEYAMEGRFSIKSDVFSFGVLMLEILSGKRNTDFYLTDSLNLIRFAWELWESGRGLELMDPLLIDPSSKPTQLRYIHVALLCVQENAVDRPTMSDVISMFSKEIADIPSPKQPAFSTGRSLMDVNSHMKRLQIVSLNAVTMTALEAR